MLFNRHTSLGFVTFAVARSFLDGCEAEAAATLQINHKSSYHHGNNDEDDASGVMGENTPPTHDIVGFEDSVRDNGDDEFHLMLEALSDARKKLSMDDGVDVVVAPDEEERDLQGETSNTRYTANYIARFKYQLGTYCSGLKPIVGLGCGDGGTISLLQVNDPTISCVDAGGGLVCSNLCADRTACGDIFVTTDYDDETFGEIYFTCSGGNKASAGGIALIGPTTGECDTSLSVFSDNFQFMHLRLGIFCFDVSIDGAYQFSSQFFECSDNSAPSRIPIDWEEDGQYNCIQGESCDFAACEVEFEGLFVATDYPRVRDQCFTIDTVTTPIPISPSPSEQASPPGEYSIRYQVGWSLANEDFWCDTVLPEITINCEGNGQIQILETSHSEIDCSDEGDGQTIKCEETCIACDHFLSSIFFDFPDVDEIGSVTFSCSGNSFDDIKATAEWPATTYGCSSITDSTLQRKIEHLLSIGPFCGSAVLGGEFSFTERTAECDAGNDWNIDILGTGSFYCIEREVYFLRGVGDFDVSVSSPVRVTANEFSDGCYTFVAAPTNPPTPGPNPTNPPTNPSPNPPPTAIPVTSPPTETPATPAPTTKQAPAPAPACEICPGDAPFSFPDNMMGTISCQQLQNLAREGSLFEGACTAAQNSAPPVCGCPP